ncbi:MAG: O-antigen ligase family protein [Clostridiaceae bacterium]|jgi:O-antigen ligase
MIWVSGQSVDPNHVAAALILPLAVLLSSDRISKWLFAVFAWALLGIALVLTGSRGGAVGVACMMVVALPGMRRGSRGMVIRTALVVVPACLVALSLVPGLLASLESRFSVVSAVLSGGAGRILLWRIGWRAFLAHPWFGTGIGSFQTAFDMTNPGYVTYSSINVAHNIYLQLLVETGVCGLALFLGLAWQIGMSYSKLARCRWAAMAGMLASSLFLGTLTASYFWLAVFFSWIAAPAVEEAGDSVATGVGGVECAR